VFRAGLVQILEADLARLAHPAVPVRGRVQRAVLLVVAGVARALRDRFRVLLGHRVGGAGAI
jgi:hypothetical protein